MNLSDQDYNKLVQELTPSSPTGKNLIWAFCVGGMICVFGQWLLNFFKGKGLDEAAAGTAVSVTLIFIASVLTGLGIFDKIAKRAGAGTLVPITGFANAMVSPAIEFKSETIVQGTCAKMFTIAGPVIVCGISASVVYGVLLVLFGGG